MALILKSLILLLLVAFVCAKTVKQSKNDKETLEKYIEDKKKEINPRWRLHYHVAGPVGWINDPNGFSYYKGEYHLFYQFYPYAAKWGPMHWGHVTSKDLVNWKQLPTALLPDEEQCFSGSAVVDGDTHVLIYTAHENLASGLSNESQYLAFSDDGVNYDKFKGNPVIPQAPNGSPDFRDPKAWKHGDHWYVIIGSKTTDERGRVLLYRSEDLIEWEFLTILGESKGDLGYMWECPDFFELDGKFVLLMSPQGMKPEGDRYKNLHQTGYIIGSFNYDTLEFTPDVGFQEMDYGHDFYAAQTMEHNGKRYVVGWFAMWESPFLEDVDGWAGAMTIIRELSIVNNRIIMKPLDDMVSLRESLVASGDFRTNVPVVFGKTAEIVIDGDLNKNMDFLLEGTEGGEKGWIKWDSESRKVGIEIDGDVRQVEWYPIGSTTLRIFLDASSVELFCGEGEVVFSSRLYPEGGWKVTNKNVQDVKIEAYSLKRSVPE
ncbi:sucrose-6-phosphate hydrolase-like [Pectinophora gossypiella]|uniref:sucrose-6-phosphate hydrolase-like n=1 Tax=Pectinophora gossypiella TaxID=13191 RepID=UPI00214E9C31|nr:sucrose-6-phosphate hydrolase-like [Pectinophora gossypiella]